MPSFTNQMKVKSELRGPISWDLVEGSMMKSLVSFCYLGPSLILEDFFWETKSQQK